MQEDVITQVAADDMHELAASVSELPETIVLKMQGRRFVVKRDRLLTLPENVLFSLSNSMTVAPDDEQEDADVMSVDFDPVCFQYILDTLEAKSRGLISKPINDFTARPLHHREDNSELEEDGESMISVQWLPNNADEIPYVLKARPTLIVLREDLEYYVVRDPKLSLDEDIPVKEVVGDSLQDNPNAQFIFNGLKNADASGSPESSLKQMLELSGMEPKQHWHYRMRSERTSRLLSMQISPVKVPKTGASQAVVVSLQKLLLFWRKPAKKCWWDEFEMDVKQEKVRVHVRRVWTLELTILGLDE